MICGVSSGVRFMDIIGREKMFEAKINLYTSETICPTCDKSNFTIFRRDKIPNEIYLNHCKCENCGQLFLYNVDKKNNPILEKDVKKNGTEHKNGI